MNQSEIEAKRRNRRQARENLASKARLVLILLLIGWERGTYFAGQSQSEVKQNQSKGEITFDTQLKSALMVFSLLNWIQFAHEA